jgi:hypothetical protein
MTLIRSLRLTFLSLFLLAGVVPRLSAQTPASTFEELLTKQTLKNKESIEVTEASGLKYKAKVVSISDRTISISANGVQRNLIESEVREIRHTRHDGLGNGIGIGVLAGLGAAAIGVATTCGSGDSECQAIAAAVFFPTFAGIGAGAGALTDWAIRKHETVFSQSTSATNRGLRIAPLVGKKTAGVKVSFGF